jgi:hypothetical protein
VTPAAQSEQGSTLTEVLVSIVILGLAITAFLLGMTTSIGSSSIGRGRATGETLLISAGEAVKDPNVNSYVCADLTTGGPNGKGVQQIYSLTVPGGPKPPPGWAVGITNVQYWDPLGGVWQDFTTLGSCPTPARLQGLTITVTSPGGEVTLSRTYVKVPPP